MTDFYQDINPAFLKESRKSDKDTSSREMLSISKSSEKKEEQKKKRTKGDWEWETSVKKNWKTLNKFYQIELPVPHSMCSLPPKEIAVRGIYADVVEEEMAPDMWMKGPGFPAKSGILAIFDVTLHCTISNWVELLRSLKKKLSSSKNKRMHI